MCNTEGHVFTPMLVVSGVMYVCERVLLSQVCRCMCVQHGGAGLAHSAGSICCACWQDAVSLAAAQPKEVEVGRLRGSAGAAGHGDA